MIRSVRPDKGILQPAALALDQRQSRGRLVDLAERESKSASVDTAEQGTIDPGMSDVTEFQRSVAYRNAGRPDEFVRAGA